MPEQFQASARYDDYTGTSAADMADTGGPKQWLVSQNLAGPAEFVTGIEVWTGENHGGFKDPIAVTFLLVPGTHDSTADALRSASAPIALRRVAVDMPVTTFLGMFKRLSLALSPKGMLTGREYVLADAPGGSS